MLQYDGPSCKRREGLKIDLVETWTEMRNLLKQKFLPVNYSRDLQSSFQDLKQGSRTVIEYSEEFLQCKLVVA